MGWRAWSPAIPAPLDPIVDGEAARNWQNTGPPLTYLTAALVPRQKCLNSAMATVATWVTPLTIPDEDATCHSWELRIIPPQEP